jgi:hypothetical protein
LLPWLSCLSVSCIPESCLRHRRSSRYQRISPLHREFRFPLLHSSPAVSNAVPQIIRGISHPTCGAAYAPFTPSKSEQRLPPLYYRGCWHRVSRGFFLRYYPAPEVVHLQHHAPARKEFTIRRPSSSTRRRFVRVAPIAKDSRLQPPVGVWAVSQSQCG